MSAQVQLMREATATVLVNDATYQTLVGRATDKVRDEDSLGEPQYPMTVYACLYAGYGRTGSEISMAVASDGANAAKTVTDLLGRAVAILTAPLLLAAGLDMTPEGEPIWEELDTSPEEVSPTIVTGSVRIPVLVFA